MPRRTAYGRRGGARRRVRGRGFMDFVKKGLNFAKENQLVSRAAGLASKFLPDKYKGIAEKVGGVAGALGYGRRRRRGGALRLSGGRRCY